MTTPRAAGPWRLTVAVAFWVAAALVPCSQFAAEGPPAPAGLPPQAEAAPGSGAPAGAAWTGSASAYWYSLPDEDDFLLPLVTLRHHRLHLEARYNYEDRSTASAFAGWVFGGGSAVAFEIVPMLGAVVGRTDGIAPAFTGTLDWKRLSVYSENEYVVDLSDHDLNFFYDWTEITIAATDWLAAGVAVQRTRTVDTSLEVQRGLMARFTRGRFNAAAYWFNPGSEDRFEVFSAGFEF